MKTVYILRGLPGSGKSSFADTLFSKMDAVIVSADDHMVNDNGDYEFSADILGECHAQCKRDYKKSIELEWPVIVVDNPNTKMWEFSWYMKYAEEHGYKVVTLIVENYHGGSSKHDVPDEKIEEMRERFVVNL